ncbi:9024_t:CDS:2 [Ambispora leptoticha]|uniref:9024_t:CDS:1 n=1 Tax=Ambispora leptoticha TaxID=144679 RepID=A0A9N9CVA4_9GLOM|nr:9024_t:CDS:2 [Ambispora leptoticha]
MTSSEWLDEAIAGGKIRKIPYDDITKIETLDEGAFAKVYLAKCNLISEEIVLKKIQKCHIKEKDSLFAFIKELKIHSNLDQHVNIISLYGISEKKNSYFLVMQYANNGTLCKFLKEKCDTLDWAKKLSLAKQMADGIQYLHSCKIIHRDLHSKNILIHDGQIKISDFNLSKDINSLPTNNSEILGATPYIDPKMFIDTKYKKDQKSDIYSLGVLFWEVSSCRAPFAGHSNHVALMSEIIKGVRENPHVDTPLEYVNLYVDCWQFEPQARPSINEVRNRLEKILTE